jgi:hypothetical protein
MSIKLECRDGSVTIPKKYYDDYLSDDWYFGSLVRYNESVENMTIEIWENKAVVLSLFDSLRFMKLIVHDGVSLDYLENVADMWCAPEWIIEAIKERKLEYNELTELDTNTFRINNHIFKCINCGTGYKIKENINTSCKYHSNTFNSNSGNYNCCERGPNDEKCVTGYHCISAYEYNKIYSNIK